MRNLTTRLQQLERRNSDFPKFEDLTVEQLMLLGIILKKELFNQWLDAMALNEPKKSDWLKQIYPRYAKELWKLYNYPHKKREIRAN